MPTAKKRKPSVLKRERQTEKRELRNKSVRTSVKTVAKNLLVTISKNDKAQTEAALKDTMSVINSAASKGVIKKSTASRKISRLAKRANAVTKSA